MTLSAGAVAILARALVWDDDRWRPVMFEVPWDHCTANLPKEMKQRPWRG